MTETSVPIENRVAAGYAAAVAELVAASSALSNEQAKHAATLAAAYGAFAAGYLAASAAAAQTNATVPFPLLPLPERIPTMSPYDVLTTAQAAEYLKVPENIVKTEAEAGRLIGRNVDGDWRFLRENILKWLRSPAGKPSDSQIGFQETPEEQEAFLERIKTVRDEINRVTGRGRYATE